MKSNRSVQNQAENGSLSIPAAEEMIEEALNELAFAQDPGLIRALRFLALAGYQAIVELCSENGRSKRRDASADTWSPEVRRGAHLFRTHRRRRGRSARCPRAARPCARFRRG